MKPLLNDTVQGTIVTPTGEVANMPTLIITSEEAAMLRRMQKFNRAHGFMMAFFCNSCWEGSMQDGVKADINDHHVVLQCRHRRIYYQGQTI